MEIRTSEESRKNIEDFGERYVNLLLEKKKVDEDIKALKQEMNEEGVPTSIVAKAINIVKANKKKTDAQRFEEETIQEYIESNQRIDDKIGELIAK